MSHTMKRSKMYDAGAIGLLLVISALSSPLGMNAQKNADTETTGFKIRYQPEVDFGICLNLKTGATAMENFGQYRDYDSFLISRQVSALAFKSAEDELDFLFRLTRNIS